MGHDQSRVQKTWKFHGARLWYWMFLVEIQGELKEKGRGRVEKNEHSHVQKQSYMNEACLTEV